MDYNPWSQLPGGAQNPNNSILQARVEDSPRPDHWSQQQQLQRHRLAPRFLKQSSTHSFPPCPPFQIHGHNVEPEAFSSETSSTQAREDGALRKLDNTSPKAESDGLLDQLDDLMHWPELKAAVKTQAKTRCSHRIDDLTAAMTQLSDADLPENETLWRTIELVTDSTSEETVRLEKSLESSKHDGRRMIWTDGKIQKPQSHKTYADVVQQESVKIDQGNKSLATEINMYLTLKDMSDGEELEQTVAIEGSRGVEINGVENLIDNLTPEDEISRYNADVDSDFNYLLNLISNGRSFSEEGAPKLWNGSHGDGDMFLTGRRSRFNDQDPQERALAESIATDGLDDTTARIVATQLWGRNKPRMAYTRNLGRRWCTNCKGDLSGEPHYSDVWNLE